MSQSRKARPLTFSLADPEDASRFDAMQPPSGAALSATYRLQFAEIERSRGVDPDRLARYQQALEPIFDALDQGGPETLHLMDKIEFVIANAAREFVVREGEARIAGRSAGGKAKAAGNPPKWHDDVVRFAKMLLATGRERHEVTHLCGIRFKDRSSTAIRRALQKHGILPKREKQAPAK